MINKKLYFTPSFRGENYRRRINSTMLRFVGFVALSVLAIAFCSEVFAKQQFLLKLNHSTDNLTFFADKTEKIDIISFLKKHEGWSDCAYPDGNWYSIGYGSIAEHEDECITREEGDIRLRWIVNDLVYQAENAFPDLTHNMRMMLVSAKFNMTVKHSDYIWEHIKRGDHLRAFARWEQIVMKGTKYEVGLTKRRNIELELFN